MAVSTRKKLLYSLLAMVLVGVLVEVVLRCIYFQLKATSPLAVQATLETLKQRASRQAAADVIERFKDTRQPTWRAFFGEQGTALPPAVAQHGGARGSMEAAHRPGP